MKKNLEIKLFFLPIFIPKTGDIEHIYRTEDVKDVHYTSNNLPTL